MYLCATVGGKDVAHFFQQVYGQLARDDTTAAHHHQAQPLHLMKHVQVHHLLRTWAQKQVVSPFLKKQQQTINKNYDSNNKEVYS
jgi:hypothetical protein